MNKLTYKEYFRNSYPALIGRVQCTTLTHHNLIMNYIHASLGVRKNINSRMNNMRVIHLERESSFFVYSLLLFGSH